MFAFYPSQLMCPHNGFSLLEYQFKTKRHFAAFRKLKNILTIDKHLFINIKKAMFLSLDNKCRPIEHFIMM
ncbi:MAG: hypothetical protein A2X49_01530 [Lentisphaerae bacterium GWF2_52_8]|nr:MAG: hypothetical protein A2X49_01530 [Lentisphaerae bacterium GWF2_52_8]